jgi:hypothetical protein
MISEHGGRAELKVILDCILIDFLEVAAVAVS